MWVFLYFVYTNVHVQIHIFGYIEIDQSSSKIIALIMTILTSLQECSQGSLERHSSGTWETIYLTLWHQFYHYCHNINWHWSYLHPSAHCGRVLLKVVDCALEEKTSLSAASHFHFHNPMSVSSSSSFWPGQGQAGQQDSGSNTPPSQPGNHPSFHLNIIKR